MTRAVLLSLFGLTLWALAFSTVYALHGVGCAMGWPDQSLLGALSFHRAIMASVWIAAIVIHLWSVQASAFGPGPLGDLPRIGAWIGLFSTLFTLAPILPTGEC